MSTDTDKFTDKEIVAVFWDHLKRDPENSDRRMTAWGGKTKLGLCATIERLGMGRNNENPKTWS